MSSSLATLSVVDARGRQISILNSTPEAIHNAAGAIHVGKRRHRCNSPGCNKSFTTSHLARHKRIHTGERNFHCLYPGCPSRFSRQDNMMQHYRTHMAPRSRRKQHQQCHRTTPESASAKQKMILAPVPRQHALICSDALHTVYRPCSPASSSPTPSPPMSPPSPQEMRLPALLPAPRILEPAIVSLPFVPTPVAPSDEEKHGVPSSSLTRLAYPVRSFG